MAKGVYPKAVWREVPRAVYAAKIVPTAIVLHSNAGSGGDLYGWWVSPGAGGLYSHFQVGLDGTVFQYCSIFRRAPANVVANSYGVSFETANNFGHSTFPGFNTDVWSEPQRLALIDAVSWVAAEAGIPRSACVDGRHGIGGHDWFSFWTTPGHVCPGSSRRSQIRSDIIPAVAGRSLEDDMGSLTSEQAKQLASAARDAAVAADQAPKAALYAAGARADVGRALDWGALGALDRLYEVELGRPVDAGGLAYWRGKIAAGASVDEVQAAIHGSPEAQRYRSA